jgi:hypothetical protein
MKASDSDALLHSLDEMRAIEAGKRKPSRVWVVHTGTSKLKKADQDRASRSA